MKEATEFFFFSLSKGETFVFAGVSGIFFDEILPREKPEALLDYI